MQEIEGSFLYILGSKAIRNFPMIRWVWDRIKGRSVSIKDKKFQKEKPEGA